MSSSTAHPSASTRPSSTRRVCGPECAPSWASRIPEEIAVEIRQLFPRNLSLEERPDVIGEERGLLHRGEVAAARHHFPTRDVVVPLYPRPRELEDLLRVPRHTRRHRYVRLRAFFRVLALPVQTRRGRDRPCHPIEHHIGEQLVLGEGVLGVAVTVTPGAELLDDPREEAGR